MKENPNKQDSASERGSGEKRERWKDQQIGLLKTADFRIENIAMQYMLKPPDC